MYNLDRYIADFLVNNKKLSAQGIGDFAIVNGQAVNGAPLVEFTADKKAYTTDDLIAFVAEQERKNKIVTGFDLESHFNQVKQFVNIGTPWIIPGLGQLQFGRNRELEFVQQAAETENVLHERIKRKQASSEPQYATYETGITATPQKSFNNGTIVLGLLIILALAAGGYYFYTNQSGNAPLVTTADTAATVTDTVVSVPSSSNMNNTVTNTQPPTTEGTAPAQAITSTTGATGFRFVLNRTVNSVYAVKRYKQLKTYGTNVYIDSVKRDNYSLYKIYLIQDAPPSDTTRLKDSLTKYYGKPVTIEKAQ